jgi:hypothetical protein
MILDRFRKKKENDPFPPIGQDPMMPNAELPEDLERFRMRPPDTRMPESRPPEAMPAPRNDYPVPELSTSKSVEDLVSERTRGDKIELILQKLDTIDTRIRLLEEKIKR